MNTESITQLGYGFKVVMPLAVGINLGLQVDDARYEGKRRITGALQNDAMASWVYVTCFVDEATISHFDGKNLRLWLNAISIPLTSDEADKVESILGCRRTNEESDA